VKSRRTRICSSSMQINTHFKLLALLGKLLSRFVATGNTQYHASYYTSTVSPLSYCVSLGDEMTRVVEDCYVAYVVTAYCFLVSEFDSFNVLQFACMLRFNQLTFAKC
jgi:hypothetical protein